MAFANWTGGETVGEVDAVAVAMAGRIPHGPAGTVPMETAVPEPLEPARREYASVLPSKPVPLSREV
jgi:hypothetical protein